MLHWSTFSAHIAPHTLRNGIVILLEKNITSNSTQKPPQKGISEAIDDFLAASLESYTPFSDLALGVECTVHAMVVRKWDAITLQKLHISSDYVLADHTGGAIHCVARANISHCFAGKLLVGEVYAISRFTVTPPKTSFRVRNGDPFVILLEGSTVVRHLDYPPKGFEKYPLQLVPIQDIAFNGSKFLIDKQLLTAMGNRLIREELSYNAKKMGELHEAMLASLNADQRAIYEKVMNAVNKQTGEFFFIYGAGGTGKTYLYKTIMAHIRSQGNIVLAVASSGIASLLLPGGRTAHSRFLIPIELLDNSTCGIKQNIQLAHLMHEVKLIIWDEAPMTHRNAFEALNRTLQDIQSIKHGNNKHKLFGGITVLLGGDFRQILPVITKGKRQDIVQACINNSPIWSNCQVLTLKKSMRVNDQQANGEIDIKKTNSTNGFKRSEMEMLKQSR